MDDPFFAEDDGEFDDFYGNKPASQPPTQTSLEPKRETSRPPAQHQSYAPASEPPTPSMAYPATPASSVGSFMSKSTDGGGLPTTSSRDKPRERKRKPRRKHSQELFQVEWEKDADVSACYVCNHDFTMLRRKHHCRRCGRVICSDCSSFWRFATSSKHRVCSYCNVELANNNNSGPSRHRTSSETHVNDRRRVPEDSLFAAQTHDDEDADNGTLGREEQDDFAMPRLSADGGHRRRRKTRSKDYGATGSEDTRRSSASASYVSATESLEGVVPVPTSQVGDRATFYSDDADKLVVDDAPGYYEYMRRSRDPPVGPSTEYAMGTGMPRPSPVTPESDGSSGVLVEAPDHPPSLPLPVEQPAPNTPAATPSKQKEKKGFAGAIKRFFGMSKSKQSDPAQVEANRPTASQAQVPVVTAIEPTVMPSRERVRRTSDIERSARLDMPRPPEIGSAALDHYDRLIASRDDTHAKQTEDDRRSTVVERTSEPQTHIVQTDSLRHTVSGYMQPTTGSADSLMRASATTTIEPVLQVPLPVKEKCRSSTRNRRDTFDDLFESPKKSNSTANSMAFDSNLPSRPWTSESQNILPSTVGVDRFDRPRRDDEMEDDFTQGLDSPAQEVPAVPVSLPSRAWATTGNETSHSSVGVDRFHRPRHNSGDDDLARSLGLPTSDFNPIPGEVKPRSTWSNVTSLSSTTSFVAANPYTYTTEQPRVQPVAIANAGGNRHRDHERTIMDDLRGSNFRSDQLAAQQSKGSVDDYFADFEKPNDYVFDVASGTYVSAHSNQVTQRHDPRSDPRSNLRVTDQVPTAEVVQTTRTHQSPVVETSQDQIDGIIVDKISSLEGELQALKQLLRMRRVPQSPRASSSTRHESRTVAKHRASIFDSDESDQDVKDVRQKSSSSKKEWRSSSHASSSRTRGVGATSRRKRKDSFADLFGDDDDDDGKEQTGNQMGTRSYESLFQIGANKTSSQDNSSDEDDDVHKLSTKKISRRSQRRRPRQNSSDSDDDAARSVTDDENEKSRFERKKPTAETLSIQTEPVVTHFQVRSTMKRKDEIDALFDSDEEDGMQSLYEATSSRNISQSKETQETPAGRSDAEDHDRSPNDSANSRAQNEVSSDEEFSSTLKTLRLRRTSSKQRVKEDKVTGRGPSPAVETDSLRDLPSQHTTALQSIGLLTEPDKSVTEDDDSNNAVPVNGELTLIEVEVNDEPAIPPKKRSSSKLSREKTVRFSTPSLDEGTNDMAGADVHDDHLPIEASDGDKFLLSGEETVASPRMQFDPLALLDGEDELPSLKKTSIPKEDTPEQAAWQTTAATFESRFKASPFRDSLLDVTDVLRNSTNLNLDELLGGDSVQDDMPDEPKREAYSSGEEDFSFEFKPKRKSVRKREDTVPTQEAITTAPVPDVEATITTSQNFDAEEMSSAKDPIEERSVHSTTSVDPIESFEPHEDVHSAYEAAEPSDEPIAAVDATVFQDDWQRMQEEEKERKRKLQLKQRQVQREKLKKQPSSNRALGKTASSRNSSSVPSSPTPGSSKKKSSKHDGTIDSEGKKKKKKLKKKEDDDGESTNEKRHRRSKHHANEASGFDVDATSDTGHEATESSTVTEL